MNFKVTTLNPIQLVQYRFTIDKGHFEAIPYELRAIIKRRIQKIGDSSLTINFMGNCVIVTTNTPIENQKEEADQFNQIITQSILDLQEEIKKDRP